MPLKQNDRFLWSSKGCPPGTPRFTPLPEEECAEYVYVLPYFAMGLSTILSTHHSPSSQTCLGPAWVNRPLANFVSPGGLLIVYTEPIVTRQFWSQPSRLDELARLACLVKARRVHLERLSTFFSFFCRILDGAGERAMHCAFRLMAEPA